LAVIWRLRGQSSLIKKIGWQENKQTHQADKFQFDNYFKIMNTKIIMTLSSIILGATGIILTFAPDIVLHNLNIDTNPTSLLLGQVIGGLYFGYSMLNWMTKESLIGGIYNRPIAIANVAHFFIAGLAIIKRLLSDPGLPKALWTAGAGYAVLGLLFIIILFRHPINSVTDK
jgi:hypothetical protein